MKHFKWTDGVNAMWNLYRQGLTSSIEGVLVVLPIAVSLSILVSDVFPRVV